MVAVKRGGFVFAHLRMTLAGGHAEHPGLISYRTVSALGIESRAYV